MTALLQAVYENGVKAVFLAIILVAGINLGKVFRKIKDAKNDSDN